MQLIDWLLRPIQESLCHSAPPLVIVCGLEVHESLETIDEYGNFLLLSPDVVLFIDVETGDETKRDTNHLPGWFLNLVANFTQWWKMIPEQETFINQM